MDSNYILVPVALAILWSMKELYIQFLRKKDSPVENIKLFKVIKDRHPMVCCHRGGASIFGPENTMYSYRLAVHTHKVDMLEIDVRLSRDGHLIILHDQTLDRTTDGVGNVENYTLEQIRKYDAAINYPELRGTGINIPTLEEVLDEFSEVQNLIIMLDFKTIGAVSEALMMVKRKNLEDRIILGSVFPKVNQQLNKMRSDRLPLAVDARTAFIYTILYYLGLLWVIPMKQEIFGYAIFPYIQALLSKGLINAMHKRGRRVAIFGPLLNDEETQMKYFNMGVDLILSDRPDVLRKCVDKIKHRKS